MSRGASGEPESEGVPDCDRGAGGPLRRMGPTPGVRGRTSSGKSEHAFTNQGLHAREVYLMYSRTNPLQVQAGVQVWVSPSGLLRVRTGRAAVQWCLRCESGQSNGPDFRVCRRSSPGSR